MTRSLHQGVVWAGQMVLLLILHIVLQRVLAGSQAAAALLSPNPDTALLPLLGAGIFVVLRLFLVLILPGLGLAKGLLLLGDWIWRRGEENR